MIELKNLPLFRTFTQGQMRKIVPYFTPIKKLIHSFLYRENEPAEFVYIVREGEFR